MKTAFVTGANRSIGFETARQLAQQGYFVYLGSRDSLKGNEAVNQLKKEGLTNVESVPIDVSDEASVAQAKDWLASKISSLDLLINNAGILGVLPQNPSTVDLKAIREVFDTNFFGAIDVTQAFLPLLKASAQSVIVHVTSGLGSLTLHSDPTWMYYAYKGAAYGPSKTALNAYTVALAYELRETSIKVNAVDPGHTATDFNHHQGKKNVVDSAAFVVKYATIGADGPTGKYFSHDHPGNDNQSPW
jgi:NAD(P)-dependent dehydrogenase (short-subunit alcohol dehydrogenase family)